MVLETTKKSSKRKKTASAAKATAAPKKTVSKEAALAVGSAVTVPGGEHAVVKEIKAKGLVTKIVVELSNGSNAVYFKHELN